MGGIYVRSDIKGIDEFVTKLSKSGGFYIDIWNAAHQEVVEEALGALREAAPRDKGGLDLGFRTKSDTRQVTEWSTITNDAVATNGFRYPHALDVGDRYHRRKGAGAGRSTKGWFRATAKKLLSIAQKVLDGKKREIEAIWRQ